MAFSFDVTGMEELIGNMDKLKERAPHVAARGLYDGAGVVADKVSQAVNGIATAPFKYAKNGSKRLPSPEEKAIVTGARHGVAKFRNTGVSVQTSVGYQNAGYAAITWNHAKTGASRTKYKQGTNGKMVHASQGSGTSMKPVPLIANAINSGTSFMTKQPFLRKAFSQSKGAATAKIEATILEEFDKLNID